MTKFIITLAAAQCVGVWVLAAESVLNDVPSVAANVARKQAKAKAATAGEVV